MATREQIGINAGTVNAAFGTWIKFRGTPDVPPIAQTSGVSYQPAQHTLYKEFNDAFKSLPDLLKGARNTYETYWEQAKKSADDYRKGKSLDEINRELDAGEVPLQYRPLLMSALEFRQGQESMQIAAQELTTKINSGEFAEMSPMELDQAVTDFMNEQLGGLQEAHGTTGGTDAFYNGYYSEVAKVREFAQQRNDQLVEQRRQQDIQIQVQAASNELGQTALSAQDIEDGIRGLKETFNLDPVSEVQAIENVIKAATSNPNGVSLINDLRSMSYRDGTLEDFFTKAYFDSAQIDVYNTLRKADAEKWSKDIERWDSLARGGAVGRLRSELNNALQASGNLETEEVRQIRQALLQSQHVAEANAKKKLSEAQVMDGIVGTLSGQYRLDLAKFVGNKFDAIELITNTLKPQVDAARNAPDIGTAQAYNSAIQFQLNNLAWTNPDIMAGVASNLFMDITQLETMSSGSLEYFAAHPYERYIEEGINPDIDPEGYKRRKQQDDNQFAILQSMTQNPIVFQAVLSDTKNWGGQEAVMIIGAESKNISELQSRLAKSKVNTANNVYSKAHNDLVAELFPDDPIRQEWGIMYSKMMYTGEQLNNPQVQTEIKKFINDKVRIDTIRPLHYSMKNAAAIVTTGFTNGTLSNASNNIARISAMKGEDGQLLNSHWTDEASKNLINKAINDTAITLIRDLGLEDITQEFRFGLDPKELNSYLIDNNMQIIAKQNPIDNSIEVSLVDLGRNLISDYSRMTVDVESIYSKAETDDNYYEKLMGACIGVTTKELRRFAGLKVSGPTTMEDLRKQVLEPLESVKQRFKEEAPSMENIGYRFRK